MEISLKKVSLNQKIGYWVGQAHEKIIKYWHFSSINNQNSEGFLKKCAVLLQN